MRRVTFGNKLLDFANIADILDEDSFIKIQEYIESYLAEVLNIKYVRLMLMKETVDGQLMLVKYALNREEETLLPIKNGDDYNGQMAYAFAKNRRLWITADSEESTLNSCEKYIDHWSGISSEELPKYRQINSEVNIKTSIIIPIRRNKNDNNNILGVVNFESKEYLHFNKHAEQELKDISYTLGKLFQLFELRRFQKSNTFAVIRELKNELNDFTKEFEGYFFERKPEVFFAFSSRADKEVTGIIRELIVNDFSKDLKLVPWDDDKNLGAITPQMLENIKSADYLICYLSEKDKVAPLFADFESPFS